MPKKIFFLVPYPLGASPSQRFRFEQYFEILSKQGYQVTVQSFLNSHNWRIFFESGNGIRKGWALLAGVTKRLGALLRAPFFDYIFIHRETAPVGPPLFEWVLARVLRKKIIYDFDDAIWLTDRYVESAGMRIVKWRSKVKSICRWSFKVSCGNQYLFDYASRYNSQSVINPTTIDTLGWHNPDLHPTTSETRNEAVIGWTGSHSTLKYLEEVTPVLQKLEGRFPQIRIMIIADHKPAFNLRSLTFVPWNAVSEIEDLMKIDIGIMPLPDDEWTKGKCGFKALQYMALGKPVVAAAVGVNMDIIENRMNGFLCASAEMWEKALIVLLNDKKLAAQMGERGRKTVVERYSVISNSDKFLSLFA